MEGAGKKKRFQICRKVWDYCRSHMWCSFAAAILVAIILLMGIMLGYTRNQYYKYLV